MLRAPLAHPGRILRDLWGRPPVIMPGVFNAFSGLCAVEAGASALYLSGAGVTNGRLGVPDIALISLNEMAQVATEVCSVSPVPVLSDADTGYGDAMNVYRSVIEMERAGLAGIHLEDQVSPKRCGHLDGKSVIPVEEMVRKIRAGVEAKRDPDFVICARTDAAGVEGLDAAIERAKAYVGAGADAVFPEGLASEEEFSRFRQGVMGPLLANMTEFGKTPIISASRFGELGYAMVIFPMTGFRMMHAALQRTYETLMQTGTQASLLEVMNTRARLYETLEYGKYSARDQSWAE